MVRAQQFLYVPSEHGWDCFDDESPLRLSSASFRAPCACLPVCSPGVSPCTTNHNPNYVYAAIRGLFLGPLLLLPLLLVGFLWDMLRGPKRAQPWGCGWKLKTTGLSILLMLDVYSDVVVTIQYYDLEARRMPAIPVAQVSSAVLWRITGPRVCSRVGAGVDLLWLLALLFGALVHDRRDHERARMPTKTPMPPLFDQFELQSLSHTHTPVCHTGSSLEQEAHQEECLRQRHDQVLFRAVGLCCTV